jgi:molybdate transport system permease protein
MVFYLQNKTIFPSMRTLILSYLLKLSLRAMAFLALIGLCAPLISLLFWPNTDEIIAATRHSLLWSALKISLTTSSISTLLVMVLGGALAFILARWNFRGKIIIDTLVDLPMVLPPMVTGLALLIFFGNSGPFGLWLNRHGITIIFTPLAVVMAQVWVALPFFVRAARAGFEGVDSRLETMSLLLGATKWRTFWWVTLPLMWPNILAGTILAWARCLGEFGATMVFAGNLQGVTQTMPLAIFSALQDNMGLALALAIILLAVAFSLIIILKISTQRAKTTSY